MRLQRPEDRRPTRAQALNLKTPERTPHYVGGVARYAEASGGLTAQSWGGVIIQSTKWDPFTPEKLDDSAVTSPPLHPLPLQARHHEGLLLTLPS
jgi:hypothetical protein